MFAKSEGTEVEGGDPSGRMKMNARWEVPEPVWRRLKKINRVRVKNRRRGLRGRPPKDDRLMLAAIFYVLRTGVPWRDLPADFGPWSSVYARFRRWCASGLFALVLAQLAKRAKGRLRHLDCSHIKLHQSGANPRGGQAGQAIGRTKGGINTKLAAVVESRGRAVALGLTAGQRVGRHTETSPHCLRIIVTEGGVLPHN